MWFSLNPSGEYLLRAFLGNSSCGEEWLPLLNDAIMSQGFDSATFQIFGNVCDCCRAVLRWPHFLSVTNCY